MLYVAVTMTVFFRIIRRSSAPTPAATGLPAPPPDLPTRRPDRTYRRESPATRLLPSSPRLRLPPWPPAEQLEQRRRRRRPRHRRHASDDACDLSADDGALGQPRLQGEEQRFARSPSSTCYAEDGLRIVGEVENIGPGLSRDLVVNAGPARTSPSASPA